MTHRTTSDVLSGEMKASMLIAIADNDDQKEPTSKAILRKASTTRRCRRKLFKKALA